MSQPFNNNSTKAEREQFVRDSYHTRYQDEVGGRWQKQVPTQVSGKDPATLYPKLPTSSPWANDPVPPEEPLGIDVSEPVITGEPHELEASLNSDLGWRKTIQDGVPPAAGPPVSRSSEPTPDTEATRANSTHEEPARHSPAVSEDGATPSFQSGRGRPAPSSPNIIRRRI
jgi:hypothetical protein